MSKKRCKIIQPIETITTWEVICPYCNETTYCEINEDVNLDTGKCGECDKLFVVNIKEWLKSNNNEYE